MLSRICLHLGGLAWQNTGGAVGCVLGVIILPRFFVYFFINEKSKSPAA